MRTRLNAIRHAELYLRSEFKRTQQSPLMNYIGNAFNNGKQQVKIPIESFSGLTVNFDTTSIEHEFVIGMQRINSVDSKLIINKEAIENRIDVIRDAIKKLSGEQARFFLAVDIKNYGTQYVGMNQAYKDILSTIFTNANSDGSAIHVDVSASDYNSLRNLAILSMTCVQVDDNNAWLGLVMKDVGATISDNAHFILVGDRFLSSIFSREFTGSGYREFTRIQHGITNWFDFKQELDRKYILFDLNEDRTRLQNLYPQFKF